MKTNVYFGTYTRRESKGIYQAEFDLETGKLSELQVFAEEPSPTYLAFDKVEYLYSVGSQDGQGGIVSFDKAGNTISHVVSEGAPLCYVSVDDKRQLVFGANYHKGQVLVYKKGPEGQLSLLDQATHAGAGPHENQTSAHVHFADLTPDCYLLTCDLGCDQVVTYDLDEEGKLRPLASYQAAAGAGPRHLVFHPHHKMAYLICELNSTVEVLIYDGLGEFEHLATHSTLPADFSDFNGTAAIRLSKDGKFLYASNRGHDSIAVYQVLADGNLELLEIVPTQGQNPRDFNLSPDGGYLLAVHQDSDNASVFKRDADTGRLTLLSHDFYVPEGVCVVFSENN